MIASGYDAIVSAAARKYGVPESHIRAVMQAESGGDPSAVSRKGAGGLMQLMPATYAEVAQREGLGPDRMDPTNNIFAGTAYLRQNLDQFGNWPDAYGAYNAGPGRWADVKAGRATVPAETRNYIPKVQAAGGDQGAGAGMNFQDVLNRYAGTMKPSAAMTEEQLLEQARGGSLPGQVGGGGRSLLDVDSGNNWLDGLGGLLGEGQTGSQPPGPSISPLQYQLAGAGNAVGQLAGVTNRRVGIGELLGALGGGLTQGAAAGQQAQRQQRADQREETNDRFNNVYRAAMAQKAMLPDARDVKTITLADGIYALNADGTRGARLGDAPGANDPKVVGDGGVYVNGQFQAAPWANAQGGGGMFKGTAGDVQGLNYLVQQGILTPQQAATWAASKGIPGTNGGYDIVPPTVVPGGPAATVPNPLLHPPGQPPGAAPPAAAPSSGSVQTGPNGVISVRPGDAIPQGEQTALRKQIDTLNKLKGAVSTLGGNIEKNGMNLGGVGALSATQGAMYEDLQTQLRLANELGVLNGPDERKLLEQISNPTSFSTWLRGIGGPSYFNAQMKVLQDKIDREVGQYQERLGIKKTDDGGGSGGGPKTVLRFDGQGNIIQ